MINYKRITKEQLKKIIQEKDLEIADLKQRATKKIEELQKNIKDLEDKTFKLERGNSHIKDELTNSIPKEFCLQLVRAICNKNEQIF